MYTYTHISQDGTLFKTADGKYINYRGTDISGIVTNTKYVKPQKFVRLTSQPKFYLITHEWDEDLEQDIVNFIVGPYSTKEEAQKREGRNDYVLLATDEAINSLAQENGLLVATKHVSTKDEDQLLQEQMIHEHLYRKCNCGSGDVWSECNGISGDTTYCG